jgi:S-(hydroxymethyl)glutathione dehydrogenase/alcohol dehydrogenase
MLGGIVPPRVVATGFDGRAVHADGGVGAFASRMVLREAGVVAVDVDLGDEELSLLGCGVTTGVGAVLNLAEVQPGSSVAVVGAGALGLWMIQGARVAGAATIVAVEPRAERRELALAVGATHAVDADADDPVEAVRALTGGRGADYVLEAAGPPAAMATALAMTRPAGTMVPAGWETLASTVTLPAVDFAIAGKRIQSCQFGGAHIRRDIPRFAAMLANGLLDAAPLITRRFGLDEVNAALAAATEREVITGSCCPASEPARAAPGGQAEPLAAAGPSRSPRPGRAARGGRAGPLAAASCRMIVRQCRLPPQTPAPRRRPSRI